MKTKKTYSFFFSNYFVFFHALNNLFLWNYLKTYKNEKDGCYHEVHIARWTVHRGRMWLRNISDRRKAARRLVRCTKLLANRPLFRSLRSRDSCNRALRSVSRHSTQRKTLQRVLQVAVNATFSIMTLMPPDFFSPTRYILWFFFFFFV